jgi:integrase/recombinase XerD
MESEAEQFERALLARGRSANTIRAYVGWLRRFGEFVGKPLEEVSLGDLQRYQRHLAADRGIDFSTFNQAFCALRVFYRDCLERDWQFDRLPFQRKARKLPEVLSPEGVEALLAACSNLKHRAVMMASYGCGLRLSDRSATRRSRPSFTRCASGRGSRRESASTR